MSSSFTDIPVSFADEDKISSIANAWRDVHDVVFGEKFSVVEFLVHTFIPRRKNPVAIRLFDRMDLDETPGYVTFEPDVIHIDQSIWALANNLGGLPQFIIAHEIGHILLHSNLPKSFSIDPKAQIKYFENEHSAEWQANKLAEHLILPNRIVKKYSNAEELINSTNAWEPIARSRYSAVHRPKLVAVDESFSGGMCNICGGISFQRKNFKLTCKSCKNDISIFSFI